MPETGISSITLPGAMKSFDSLHSKFGEIDFKDICKPAIKYAQEGVVISPRVAFDCYHSSSNLKGVAKKFYTKRGKPFGMGDIFYAPQQAKVLKEFAKNGSKISDFPIEYFPRSISEGKKLKAFKDGTKILISIIRNYLIWITKIF